MNLVLAALTFSTFLVWTVQDLRSYSIQALYSIPVLVYAGFVNFPWSIPGLIVVYLLYRLLDLFGTGDFTMLAVFTVSTIHNPLLMLQSLLLGQGLYMYIMEKTHGKYFPVAPGFFITTAVYYLLL